MVSLLLAIIGSVVTLAGVWPGVTGRLQQHCFLWGAVLLLLSAIRDADYIFIILEIVVVLGAAAAFLPWSASRRGSLPMIAAGLGSGYLLISSTVVTPTMMIGIVGLTIVAIGFAIRHPVVYLSGGLGLIIYSGLRYSAGNQLALIFLVLNMIFVALTLRNYYSGQRQAK